MSGGLYNPHMTPKGREILKAVQGVGVLIRTGGTPTREQLHATAALIEAASGTFDLDPRNPQINQILTAWNQFLLGSVLKQLDPTPYTALVELVWPEDTAENLPAEDG